MTNHPFNPALLIAKELKLTLKQVEQALKLFDQGSTVPFIARYRKEVTGNLDEVMLRSIEDRRAYLLSLQQRKEAILDSIASQGKLTEELKARIEEVQNKTELEDLYQPYKPKRRTKAMIAKEKGLEPLAWLIVQQPIAQNPEEAAQSFISLEKGVHSLEEALEGARHIVAEQIADTPEIRALVRSYFQEEGAIVAKVRPKFKDQQTKWNLYYDFKEAVAKIPSHRYLAIKRGEQEEVLDVKIEVDKELLCQQILQLHQHQKNNPWSEQLRWAVEDSYKRLLHTSMEVETFVALKLASDEAAIEIFAQNLEQLLLNAPLGAKPVVGVDPGLRTGCKCVALSHTGSYLETITFSTTASPDQIQMQQRLFAAFVAKHAPFAIAVGNGTGNRECEEFIRHSLALLSENQPVVVSVNEAGASVYSASDVAREEFPDLDLTLRGAISIARRLQDPLAELVKIEPKSIGVGQYQHDVYQPSLERKLHQVVESCVNRVGVELNTASFCLLSYVAGIGPSLAKKIVLFRDAKGGFKSRQELLKVNGLGDRTFEQAAGFLRIQGASNPLDSSAVHPERYALVEQIMRDNGLNISEVIGKKQILDSIDKKSYLNEEVGMPTLEDIFLELMKPGRDPREQFTPPAFNANVTKIADLSAGMILEGIVTNVTAFGAFVDIGVHQDGLVHISELSDQFISSPSQVVSAGQKIRVQVVAVDLERNRISLTAKLNKSNGMNDITPKEKEQKRGKQQQMQGKKEQKRFGYNPFSGL